MDHERVDERLGRAINGYLHHYVLVVDAKAVAIAAASWVVVGVVVSPGAKSLDAPWNLLGGALAVAAAIVAGSVLYPRTPRYNGGHLFWFDIRNFGSPTEYWKSLTALDEDAIDFRIAVQLFDRRVNFLGLRARGKTNRRRIHSDFGGEFLFIRDVNFTRRIFADDHDA